jgi:hypothetical protein
MDFHPAGSRATRQAPAEYFTGNVLQDPLIMAPAPARLNASRVSFAPGAQEATVEHCEGPRESDLCPRIVPTADPAPATTTP